VPQLFADVLGGGVKAEKETARERSSTSTGGHTYYLNTSFNLAPSGSTIPGVPA